MKTMRFISGVVLLCAALNAQAFDAQPMKNTTSSVLCAMLGAHPLGLILAAGCASLIQNMHLPGSPPGTPTTGSNQPVQTGSGTLIPPVAASVGGTTPQTPPQLAAQQPSPTTVTSIPAGSAVGYVTQ